MSDFRSRNYDYRNSQDPSRGDPNLDPSARGPNSAWGWIAAAVFLVVVLAVALGAGHRPGQIGTRTAFNDATPQAVTPGVPSATHMMAPTTVPPPSTGPAVGTPTPPVSSAPHPSAPLNSVY
jgi:hypothetical protein